VLRYNLVLTNLIATQAAEASLVRWLDVYSSCTLTWNLRLFVNNSNASAEVVPPSIRKTARKAAVNFSGIFNILNYNARF
jgi:hypothetical protein